MNDIPVKAGDLVVTQFGVYQHWSIVSDQLCLAGKNMLISATKRTGTVQEEPWDVVTQGKLTYVAKIATPKLVSQILDDARSKIGDWAYSVLDNNCEHFAKWASGLEFSSSQVNAGVGGAAIGAIGVAALSENPNALKILGGAVLLAGVAVLASKPIEEDQV